MDVDGDGYISMYEMEYFYEEMVQRMEAMGIETLPFEDCLCQVRISLWTFQRFLILSFKELKTIWGSLWFVVSSSQMLDMVRPAEKLKVSLNDLKKSQMTPLFFDTFFNLEKYLEHEQKDPFANLKVRNHFTSR